MTNLQFGIISDIDFKSGLARVYFEEDEVVSAPLKISVMRSKGDQISFPFSVNEHVWCIMDENFEYGVIGGAIYDEGNKPANSEAGKLLIRFADNSTIEYDRNSHILSFDIKGDISVKSTGNVTIKSPQVKIDAVSTEITGTLMVAGVASVGGLTGVTSGAPGGDIEAGESILKVQKVEATGDVVVGDISLKSHKHTSGGSGSPTGPPLP
jgi:phage baseplate assembly protein V